MSLYEVGFRDALELGKAIVVKYVKDEKLRDLLLKKFDYFVILLNEKRLTRIANYLGSLEQI